MNPTKQEMKPSPNNMDTKPLTSAPSDGSNHIPDEFMEKFVEYQGFWYQPLALPFVKAAQDDFQALPGDVLLATCPKSGTTWLKALAFAILTREQYGGQDKPPSPLLSTFPHHCVPYIEQPFLANSYHHVQVLDPLGRRLTATHIPYTSLPKSVLSQEGCKVVYLCREPKDTLVSGWYFLCNAIRQAVPFDEFFTDFCEGKSIYGPCWDHILEYWKASTENPNKVLFLKFEDLKIDTSGCVKRLAQFMAVADLDFETCGGLQKNQ